MNPAIAFFVNKSAAFFITIFFTLSSAKHNINTCLVDQTLISTQNNGNAKYMRISTIRQKNAVTKPPILFLTFWPEQQWMEFDVTSKVVTKITNVDLCQTISRGSIWTESNRNNLKRINYECTIFDRWIQQSIKCLIVHQNLPQFSVKLNSSH